MSFKIYNHALKLSKDLGNKSWNLPFQFSTGRIPGVSEADSKLFSQWTYAQNNGKPLTPHQKLNILTSHRPAAYEHMRMLFNTIGPLLERLGTNDAHLFQSKSNPEGHEYYMGQLVQLGFNPKDALKNGLWVIMYLSCIVPDLYIMKKDSPMANKLCKDNLRPADRIRLTEENKVALEQSHDEVIKAFTEAKKVPLEEYCASIGGNMIDLGHIELLEHPDGTIQVMLHAKTIPNKHGLYGLAAHCLEWKPTHPETLKYILFGSGKGHVFADIANGSIGNVLWTSVGDTMKYVWKSMHEQNSCGSEARDRAYTGLLYTMFKESPYSGLRRLMTMAGMSGSTRMALEISHRVTYLPINSGAMVPYKPLNYHEYDKFDWFKGNSIEIDSIDWLTLPPEQACGLLDPTKFDSTRPTAPDTMGGLRDADRIINTAIVMHPSYTLEETGLARSLSQADLAKVEKTYEEAMRPFKTDTELLKLKKFEQEVSTKEMKELINLGGRDKLVLPMELVRELAWRGTGAAVVNAWAWSLFAELLPNMQDELANELPPDTKDTEVKEYLEGLNTESTIKISGADEITKEWHLDTAMTLSLEHNDPQTVERLDTLLTERSVAVATSEAELNAKVLELGTKVGHEKVEVEKDIAERKDRVDKEKASKEEVEHALEVRKHEPAARDEVRKREQERMHEIRNRRP